MKLEDGKGTGVQARVNANQQLDVFAVVEAEDKYEARRGKTWSVTSSSSAAGANDYIFYFENTGTETYVITDIRAISSSGAALLSVDAVSGTPTFTSGTDLTPVNRNRGSSATMTATIKQDTNTTGLTDDGRLFPIQIEGTAQLAHLRTSSNIIIPPGQAIAIEVDAPTPTITTTLSFSILEDL
jgi:hypothetical protein